MQSHFVQLSFGAHVPNHHETGGHVLQHLRNIFAQLAQLALALRTHRFLRLVPARLSRQMIRQSASRGFRCRRSRRGDDRSWFCRVDSFSLRFDSSSSSRNSNCSICRCSFSDFRPNCMRCSLASSSFRCSISRSREISCSSLLISSCVAPGSALAAHRQEERSDRGAPPLPCAEYRMNSRVLIRARAKKVVERISQVTPTTAAPRCAPAAANRCLPAASITALASAKPCRSPLAATRSVRAPAASRTNTTRRRHTTEL